MKLVGANYSGTSLQDEGEKRIAAHHRSTDNQKFLRKLDYCLKTCYFEMTSKDGLDPKNLIGAQPNYLVPPVKLQDIATGARLWFYTHKPVNFLCIHLVLIYLAVKMLAGALVHFEYSRLMKVYKSQTGKDLHELELTGPIPPRLVQLSQMLDWLGVPLFTMPGFGSLVIGTVGFGELVFHQATLVLHRYFWPRLRIDEFGFLFNPIAERRRLIKELELIASNLSARVSRYVQAANLDFEELDEPSLVQTRTLGLLLFGNRWSRSRSSMPVKGQIEVAKFCATLRRLIASRNPVSGDFEWPRTVTADWYINYSTLCFRIIRPMRRLFLSWSFLLFTVLLYTELSSMVDGRLERHRTKSDRSTFGYHIDPLRLKPLELVNEILAYSSYNTTTSDRWQLYSIEAKYYFTLRRLIFLVELFFLYIVTGHLIINYVFALVATVLNKIVWLNQLIKQMNESYRETSHHNHRDYTSLIKAYINFELFRRQIRPDQLHESLRLDQVIIYNAFCLGFCYLIASSLSLDHKVWIFSYSSAMMLLTNIPILFCSFKTKRISQLMWALSYLIARLNSVRIKKDGSEASLVIPLDLWRRQVLDESLSRELYSSRVVGSYVTYELFMTANAYFLAILLMMLRVSSE